MKHKLILAAVAWLLLTLLGQKSALAGDFETVWSVPVHLSSALYFTHDTRWVITPGAHETQILNVSDGSFVPCTLPGFSELCIPKDDKHIIGVLDSNLAYFSTETWENEQFFDTTGDLTGGIYLTNDEDYLLATTTKGFIIFDYKTGKLLRSRENTIDYNSYENSNVEIKLSCDKSKIYLRTYEVFHFYNPKPSLLLSSKIKVYDFNTLDSIACIAIGTSDNYSGNLIRGFELSHDCSMLAIGYANADVGVKIFRLDSMKLIRQLNINGYACNGFKFTKDDKYLITIGNGAGYYAIDLRNIETGIIEKHLGGGWNTIDISSDEKYIAASGPEKIHLLKYKFTTVEENNDNSEIIYPNPTTGNVLIQINLPVSSILKAELSDINSNLIANLYNNFTNEGENNLQFNLNGYVNGTYFIRLTTVNFNKTFKVIINR